MVELPKNAKRVFSGIKFEMYQWEQELFDGSTATFEVAKRRDTVQIIAVHDGKILVVEEEQPFRGSFLGFIGGFIEKETPLECAKRELLEETGMESSDWELLHTYEQRGHVLWNSHLYLARSCKKVQEPELEPGEKIKILPVNFDKFMDILADERFRAQDIAYDFLRKERADTLDDWKEKILSNI